MNRIVGLALVGVLAGLLAGCVEPPKPAAKEKPLASTVKMEQAYKAASPAKALEVKVEPGTAPGRRAFILREGTAKEGVKAAPQAEKKYGFLGVAVVEVPAPLADQLNLDCGRGLLVAQVLPDSPAAKAGLERNDVITLVGDQVIYSGEQLKKLVAASKPGSLVQVSFVHKGKLQSARVTLGGTAQHAVTAPGGMQGMSQMPRMMGGAGMGPGGAMCPMCPFRNDGTCPMMGGAGMGPGGPMCPFRNDGTCPMMTGAAKPGAAAPGPQRGPAANQPRRPFMGFGRGRDGQPMGFGWGRGGRDGRQELQFGRGQPVGPQAGAKEPGRPMMGAQPGREGVERREGMERPGAPQAAPVKSGVLIALVAMKEDVAPKVWPKLYETVARLERDRKAGPDVLAALVPFKGDLSPRVWGQLEKLFAQPAAVRPQARERDGARDRDRDQARDRDQTRDRDRGDEEDDD